MVHTDDVTAFAAPAYPILAPAALHGPLGAYVAGLEGYTEAAPGPLMLAMLAGVGAMVGRGPHVLLDGARHGPNIFAVITGATAGGRKSTAMAHARNLLRDLEPDFWQTRTVNGFGSGEAVIAELAPPEGADGASDVRLLIEEHELGALLVTKRRDGSTLSAIIRCAFDGAPLANRTKGDGKLVATEHHVGILGAITASELRALLTAGDAANGFANRFVFALGYRAAILPEPPPPPTALVRNAQNALTRALDAARGVGAMGLTAAARDWWHAWYRTETTRPMPDDLHAQLGSRHPAILRRLALGYALADRCRAVDVAHLTAAAAVLAYSTDTLHVVFPPDQTMTPDTRTVLDAITVAGPDGLARGDWRRLAFRSNNIPTARLDAVAAELRGKGLARFTVATTAGRSRETWYLSRFAPSNAADDDGKNGNYGQKAPDGADLLPITPKNPTISTPFLEGVPPDTGWVDLTEGAA